MSQTGKKTTKADRKKQLARTLCLVLAIVMVGTTLLAAVLSRVF